MPSPNEIKDLARLYASLTPEQVAAHEDWVRRYKAEQEELEAKLAAAREERRKNLLGMTDEKAVFYALQDGIQGYCDEYLPEEALKVLRDAGFVRRDPLLEEIRTELRKLAAPYGNGRFGRATIEPDFTKLCGLVGLTKEDF